jgi:hypothetical protein
MAALSSHLQLLHLLSSFSSQNTSQISILQSALDDLSHDLVSDKSLRLFYQLSTVPLASLIGLNRIQLGSQPPSIWTPLHEVWGSVTRAQSAGIGLDRQLILSLAKFTRNLIADVPFNQKNAL